MNILVVTNHFWPEEFRINDLAYGLVERGHSVSVITGIPNYPTGKFNPGYGLFKRLYEIHRGIKIFRMPLVPRGSGSGFRLVLNYASYAISSSLLSPFRCREHYDLIFVFESSPITVGLPALVLKKLRGTPIVFWVQDLWPETLSATGVVRSDMILSWVGHFVRIIYKNCDRILIQSKAFSESVTRLTAHHGKILYFPNSAEAFYRPIKLESSAPERDKVPPGFCVMFAGNIGVAQDFETILSAAERLKCYQDINWLIIGDGRRRNWVEQEVVKRGLQENVHLLGRHPVESMPRFFSLADVLLVTLKKESIFSLTIPSKVQSYLACAKPVIAGLDGEGAKVIEEAAAGYSCPAECPDKLAEVVFKMYRLSASERGEMGNRGREYYLKEFDREMLLDRLEMIMHEVSSISQTEKTHNFRFS